MTLTDEHQVLLRKVLRAGLKEKSFKSKKSQSYKEALSLFQDRIRKAIAAARQ